jgi:DNA-binding MarR family transcriptional regulator
MKTDRVERILSQWRDQRPDLDVSSMAVVGRVKRLARIFEQATRETFSRHGLEPWEFDVLASLRRAGPPYQLSAGALGKAMMITSGSVTHRIDGLEARGLVRRNADPEDRRGVLIELSPEGLRCVDGVLVHHLATEREALVSLSPARQKQLAALLSELLLVLEVD